MEEGESDERYDSFVEYVYNYDIYELTKSSLEEDDHPFPNIISGEYTEHRDSIIMDCLKLKTYLMKFHSSEECQNKNCCQYINYLLNYMVRNYYKSQAPIFKVYISYMNQVKNNTIMKLCMPKIKYMIQEKYQKMNELYNAYKLCHIFISNKRGTSSCSYATSCSRAYNRIINEYPNLHDAKFCKALKDFKTYLEGNEHGSTINCDIQMENLLSYPNSCNNLLENSMGSITNSEKHTERSQIQETPTRSLDIQEQLETEKTTGVHTAFHKSSGTMLPIALFCSGIGVLLILLSFYKFTPLQNFLRLRTQRFRGISKRLVGEEYEIQQHNSEYEEGNEEYNGYNISYSSL